MAAEQIASKGKAVVTGASSGIGRVYADRLAQRGYDLILVARRADRLREVAEEVQKKHGVRVETVVADLADAAELQRVADQLQGDEAVQMLVNNAGTSIAGPVAEGDAEELVKMVELNSTAPLRLSLAVLPGFKRRQAGTLINVGSVVGAHPYGGVVVYSATKAFLLSFTSGLATELEGSGVRVQLVAPAATISEIWEKGGLSLDALPKEVVMTTEDCVDAALRGLDAGEVLTYPSVEDAELVDGYGKSGFALLSSSQTGRPASRYRAQA